MSFVFFPSLVRLPSPSLVYLFLFWISWVPGGHCLSPLPHFFGWSSIERLLVVGSYCSDFKVIRACLVGILPLYHLLHLPYTCPIMRTSSGPTRSSGLCIGGSSVKEPDLGQTGEGFDRSTIVVDRVPLVGPPSLSGKGKSKVSEIRYPDDSDYLRAAVKYANVVVPSRVEPLYEKTFVTRYKPHLGVQVWCLDLLTTYVVQVPKMVYVTPQIIP